MNIYRRFDPSVPPAWPFLIACLVGFVLPCPGFAAGKPPAKSVTTTWLPDPFPNVAPKAVGRRAVVEAETASRTPSVLFDVYDVENDRIEVASFTQPANGTATLNPDGTFTYTPKPGFLGADAFRFTISDDRVARSGDRATTGGDRAATWATATMEIDVVRPTGNWSATRFTDLAEVQAGGEPIRLGNSATVPRAVDWNGDGRLDLLVGADGGVWMYRNEGTKISPRFAAGVRVRAGDAEIRLGGRTAIAIADMDRDGKQDLVAASASDRKVRWYRNLAASSGPKAVKESGIGFQPVERGIGVQPVVSSHKTDRLETYPTMVNRLEAYPTVLAPAVVLRSAAGGDFIAEDVRADVADWNGDGLPDVITGAWAGDVKIAYNTGTAAAPAFAAPATALDAGGTSINGAYNLNVRLADVNQDGLPDLVDSYNWGNVNFRINQGSRKAPRLADAGRFAFSGRDSAAVDLHALCDGPIVDFADLNGDGTIDLLVGGERGGTVHIAFGQSGERYLDEIREIIAAHPVDLGPYLNDPANAAAKGRMQALQGALYDFVVSFATPSQRNQLGRGLVALIRAYPQYFKLQTHDIKRQPGIPSLAVQAWLTLLMVKYHDPAARKALVDAAGFTGGYRKLVEEIGLIYADNGQNPRGAEAIFDWVRTIPREPYPGTGITANDWLGGREFLVRGHVKNTFNGQPVDGGEYGFGNDARAVIGDRGSENWFMTVVKHEACHDLDAYVRQHPDLNRRWGQTLVLAGGPDMWADPKSGWLSMDLTRAHFREAGLWDGDKATWEAAWKKYWSGPPGADWRSFGFMRGNIDWFYGAPQESLATQGNQFWNSTEGRVEVAIDRWKRGYKSNLTEVLLYLDIWSVGLNKVKFYETDNACNQTVSFAQLRRNRFGYIDRIDLGDRFYEFVVDDKGVVTEVLHAPSPAPRGGKP